MIIRHEEPADIAGIRKVNEQAFESHLEARLVDALRSCGAVVISMVAEEGGLVIGHILFTEITLGEFKTRILGLGPMAVLLQHQGKGVGTMLMEAGLEECKAVDADALVVLGYPEFYTKFGFLPSTKYMIKSEYDVPPEVFMVKEIKDGSLLGKVGTIKYHRLFSELG